MRLITIPFSHYSEKARWALDHIGAPYAEEARLPMMHLLSTVPLGGRSVPVLVDGQRVFTDSTDILMHLAATAPAACALLPEDPSERAAALDIEEYCDRRVGVAARAWIYSEMLTQPWKLGQRLGRHRPPAQRAVLPMMMTLAGPVIARSYKVKPGEPAAWLQKLRDSFEEVSRRLASSSGSYLVGDRFSAADLTFAALAAPALLPEQHPHMKTELTELPASVSSVVHELRRTPAGAHALRMYREHRAVS